MGWFFSSFLTKQEPWSVASEVSVPVSVKRCVVLSDHKKDMSLQSDLAYPVLFYPEENRWLPIYSIWHAYIQFVCSIIRFPRLSGYFCGKRMCAVERGLTVPRLDRPAGTGPIGRVITGATCCLPINACLLRRRFMSAHYHIQSMCHEVETINK